MPDQQADPGTPPVKLSLWDSICLIIGIIIGASIYQTSPEIFRSSGNAENGMLAWVLGGVVSLIGALCYAELASAYRTSGGDYTYLTKAYGSKIGFIFAWAELAVIRTGGSIAFMAYVFAKYATEFYNLGDHSKLKYALGGIISLTFINAIGVKPGRLFQNVLTSANIIGLLSIAIIGLVSLFIPSETIRGDAKTAIEITTTVAMSNNSLNLTAVSNSTAGAFEPLALSFAFTMVMVFYAYGGWNEAAFIASEVKNPKRNVRRALILGTLIVIAIYLAVNAAYLSVLGYSGVCESKTIAADVFAVYFGETGRKLISALVMVSSLGSVHGLLFTGMRLYGTFGRDHRLFAWLASKDDSHHARGALFAQAGFSILLIAFIELANHWRRLLMEIASRCGMDLDPTFHENGDISKLVACTAPVFWIFFLLTGASLFVLRWKEPDQNRPYRVPLYPLIPLIFVLSCAFMLWKSMAYALDQQPAEAILVCTLMLLGIPLCFYSGRVKSKTDDAGNLQ